jgi:MFS family permease
LDQTTHFLIFNQTLATVGSAALAQSTTQLLGDPSLSKWAVIILNLVSLCFVVPLGHAGDVFGRRWLIAVSSLILIVGFIIVSREQDITTFFAGLTLAGSAIATQPQLYAVASEQLSLRRHCAAAKSALAVTTGVASLVALITT